MSFALHSSCASQLLCILLWALEGGSQAAGQSTFKWTTNYYAVTGNSVREIISSLARSGPAGQLGSMHASTQWKVDWHYRTETSANGCVCSSFTTDVTITTLLPRWLPSTNASVEVRQAWRSYINALTDHENGHAGFAVQAVAEMKRRVDAIGEVASCSALAQQLDQIGNEVLEEHRKKEKDYDIQTRHGATQGAFLRAPPRPGP